MKSIYILLAFALSFAGCSSVAIKRQNALSKIVYAEDAALKAGRYDLARSYDKQAKRLVAPPKKAIVVKPVISAGKSYVVLPKDETGDTSLNIGSPALDTLLSSDKALEGQFQAEDKDLSATQKATDKVIIAESKELAKVETAHKSFFGSIWGKITIFGIPVLLIVGAIVLCILFPTLLPVFTSILGDLYALAKWAVGEVAAWLTNQLNKWHK